MHSIRNTVVYKVFITFCEFKCKAVFVLSSACHYQNQNMLDMSGSQAYLANIDLVYFHVSFACSPHGLLLEAQSDSMYLHGNSQCDSEYALYIERMGLVVFCHRQCMEAISTIHYHGANCDTHQDIYRDIDRDLYIYILYIYIYICVCVLILSHRCHRVTTLMLC